MDELFNEDEYFMRRALDQAQRAFDEEEVPIGAVVGCNGKVIGKGYNQTEKLTDVTAHAEMIAITAAATELGGKYLDECILYVTIEPCVMCAGALYWSKIGRVVYGAYDEKNGYLRVTRQTSPFHPKTEVVPGVLQDECASLMKAFFRSKR